MSGALTPPSSALPSPLTDRPPNAIRSHPASAPLMRGAMHHGAMHHGTMHGTAHTSSPVMRVYVHMRRAGSPGGFSAQHWIRLRPTLVNRHKHGRFSTMASSFMGQYDPSWLNGRFGDIAEIDRVWIFSCKHLDQFALVVEPAGHAVRHPEK